MINLKLSQLRLLLEDKLDSTIYEDVLDIIDDIRILNDSKDIVLKTNDFLNRKLTYNELESLLKHLFNMNINESGVIFDEEGDEFYKFDYNLQYDLYTLKGILLYYKFIINESSNTKIKNIIKTFLNEL